MKKYSLFILILFCLVITGCASKETKEAKTLNDFEEICTNSGFTVNDNLLSYTDEEIKGAKIAKIDSEHIEMVVYDTAESAKKVQKKHIDDFMKIRNTMVTVDKKEGKNFYEFKMISNGYYWITTRIDNTLIFAKIPVDYKDKVDIILIGLGY